LKHGGASVLNVQPTQFDVRRVRKAAEVNIVCKNVKLRN